MSDLRADADLRVEIQAAVDEANRAEVIGKFVVLPTDVAVEGGEFTPRSSSAKPS